MKRRFIVLLACLMLLSGLASAKKILFYEIGTPTTYSKDGGYSKLRDKMINMGYDVASITKGELSREKVDTYDILIIHASKQLTTEEISTIVWFVSSRGGGMLIAGGTPNAANRIMPIFGMTMDEGTLTDFTDAIEGMDNTNFEVNRFTSGNITRFMRLGVNTIGFYQGSGLITSGDAKWVARGDADTYSDTLSFPSGSEPPIVGASIFGNGLVVGLGDADMFVNDNIDNYDNMLFASNIIDWLSTARSSPRQNISCKDIDTVLAQCNLERNRLNVDRESLINKVDALESNKRRLDGDLDTCTIELDEIKHGKIGPFTRTQLAIVLGGLFILVAAVILPKKGIGSKKKAEGEDDAAEEGDDILSELGYEFEEDTGPKKDGGEASKEDALGGDDDLDASDLEGL